jgi:hypothetical protein
LAYSPNFLFHRQDCCAYPSSSSSAIIDKSTEDMAGRLTAELAEAAKEGNLERCQQLLSEGADLNAKIDM